jgi:hypothetical protein
VWLPETVRSEPRALPEFRGQPGGQRVACSAKSLRTSIPIIQVDVDRDTGHGDGGIAVASAGRDNWTTSSWRRRASLAAVTSAQGNLRCVPRCLAGMWHPAVVDDVGGPDSLADACPEPANCKAADG